MKPEETSSYFDLALFSLLLSLMATFVGETLSQQGRGHLSEGWPNEASHNCDKMALIRDNSTSYISLENYWLLKFCAGQLLKAGQTCEFVILQIGTYFFWPSTYVVDSGKGLNVLRSGPSATVFYSYSNLSWAEWKGFECTTHSSVDQLYLWKLYLWKLYLWKYILISLAAHVSR